MLARPILTSTLLLIVIGPVFGQVAATADPASGRAADSTWRRAGQQPASPAFSRTVGAARTDTTAGNAAAAKVAARPTAARVSSGNGTLPNNHGQVWREYDISPYTLRVTSTKRPEQAIVDWILRETGYEAWHSEPLGILSATPRTLRVYHTPEMQATVTDLVDRFVSSEAETTTFSLRVVTVGHPDWRTRAQRLLRPVAVQTPGVGAWLLAREDAAVLMADLRRRNDYREHSSPHLLVNNGQATVVSALRGRDYVRDVVFRPDAWPGFEVEPGQIDEGFSLEFSPLLSVDRRMVDATIKCNIDQVEKMFAVMLDVPTAAAPRQRTKIEVPQMSHFRFHERFRWPVGQVLLVGMGMVALPVPVDGQPTLAGIPLPLPSSPPRADLMVFVEAKGKTAQPPNLTLTPRPDPLTSSRRY